MNKYGPKNIDKVEAQRLYNEGMSTRQLAEHYRVSGRTISRLSLVCRTISEASKLASPYKIYTKEGLASLSKHAKERGLGGYRPHPNRGKYYNGVWFDSSWEVIVAESLDENNIEWIRPKCGFVWKDTRRYYPDFYLPAYDIYLDPKNPYLQEKDKENSKMRNNNIKVLVHVRDELSEQIKAYSIKLHPILVW